MTFRPELIDELLKDDKNPKDLMGEGGIFKQLTKALIERCLTAELDTHLEEEKQEAEPTSPKNRRNGHSKKTIKENLGKPRSPSLVTVTENLNQYIVQKGQTRFNGFDDKILPLYARGMTTRNIQDQLQDLYGVEVSHCLISNVTEAAERKAWQNRALGLLRNP